MNYHFENMRLSVFCFISFYFCSFLAFSRNFTFVALNYSNDICFPLGLSGLDDLGLDLWASEGSESPFISESSSNYYVCLKY